MLFNKRKCFYSFYLFYIFLIKYITNKAPSYKYKTGEKIININKQSLNK